MMQIGDLAAKAGTTTRTIRYYEELGIVEPAERSEGGFRLYSEVHVRRLRVVQGLKTLGFDLERIRELFSLHSSADTGGDLSRAMIQVLDDQQREIDRKITAHLELKERNALAIEILQGCSCCSIKVFDRDCHQCDVYLQHSEVPDVVECAIYSGDCTLNGDSRETRLT
jgi:DNA-binding transcriptional MerR regulator